MTKAKYFTIKYIKNRPYIYIWGKRKAKETNDFRSRNQTKNYTAVENWQSLGCWYKIETKTKLVFYLRSKGLDDHEIEERIGSIDFAIFGITL